MLIKYLPDGSGDCPLIMLQGREPEVVARLREEVAALAEARVARVAVHELPGFESVDGCRLFFSTGTWDRGTYVLREQYSFECQLRPVVWYNIEGLLEPFAVSKSTGGCHQWLDDRGDIQLLISDDAGW